MPWDDEWDCHKGATARCLSCFIAPSTTAFKGDKSPFLLPPPLFFSLDGRVRLPHFCDKGGRRDMSQVPRLRMAWQVA